MIPIPNKEKNFKPIKPNENKQNFEKSAAKKKNEILISEKKSVKNSIRKSYAEEEEENVYDGGFNFFNKEVSVKESKISKKESIFGKSEQPKTEKSVVETVKPKKKKLKKARIEEDDNMEI